MINLLINITVVIATFIGMECVAWVAHKYVMHGFGWALHKDHHEKKSDHFFEKNDYFFLIFAFPGILCLVFGSLYNKDLLLFIGSGITLYGAAYFLVHDIFIHQRFKIFRNSDSAYLRAIRKAHKVHHKYLTKLDSESFGMLWVPIKYLKEAKKTQQK